MTANPGSALPRELIVHRPTTLPPMPTSRPSSACSVALVEDHRRTAAICADILDALDRGRHCLVLSQWTEHLEYHL